MLKEYTIIALTVQNLVNDGYVISKIGGNQIKVVNKDEGFYGYFTEPEFKQWILEKALDY